MKALRTAFGKVSRGHWITGNNERFILATQCLSFVVHQQATFNFKHCSELIRGEKIENNYCIVRNMTSTLNNVTYVRARCTHASNYDWNKSHPMQCVSFCSAPQYKRNKRDSFNFVIIVQCENKARTTAPQFRFQSQQGW